MEFLEEERWPQKPVQKDASKSEVFICQKFGEGFNRLMWHGGIFGGGEMASSLSLSYSRQIPPFSTLIYICPNFLTYIFLYIFFICFLIYPLVAGRKVREKQGSCAHRKNNFDSKWDLYVARKDALL